MWTIWGDGLDDMQLTGCAGGGACLLLAAFLSILGILIVVLILFVVFSFGEIF